MSVSSRQRHTRQRPCKVCDGYDSMPRGQGKRCSGFISDDGEYEHCSREELAGDVVQDDGGTYAHKMHGACRCGTTHNEDNRPRMDVIEALYDYTDEDGALLFQVVRKPGKRFLQRKPDGAGGWEWKVNGVRRALYRLRDVVQDDGERPVYFVEGEKDADTLAKRGHTATCNPGGAEAPGRKVWRESVGAHARTALQGRDVIVIADRDTVGREHARMVAGDLEGAARSVRVLECTKGKDVTDHLLAGGTLEELVPIQVQESGTWSQSDAETGTGPRAVPLLDRARAIRARGPLRRLATGLATLDKSCRGGFSVPRLIVIGGAPGAGKTSVVVWIAVTLAQAGVPVVVLAVDEGADDILMRLALLLGIDVELLEANDSHEWDAFESKLATIPLTLVDGDDGWSVESAAAHLATLANGQPAVLVVDSAQTVDADGTADAESPRARADAVVRSLKHVVRCNPFLVLATSELARGAYRSRNNQEHINDLAAFKESGSIEYAAQTALVLRSVPDGGGVVDVAVAKNRGGKKDGFRIEIDGRTQVREVAISTKPDQAETKASQLGGDCVAILKIVVNKPGLPGKAATRTAARAAGLEIGNDRVDAALERLLDEGRIENRGTRNRPLYFVRSEAA